MFALLYQKYVLYSNWLNISDKKKGGLFESCEVTTHLYSIKPLLSYLIFVTGTTGGACVKKISLCKKFQIECQKLHFLHFLGLFFVICGCLS